jgi:hypothetical protein
MAMDMGMILAISSRMLRARPRLATLPLLQSPSFPLAPQPRGEGEEEDLLLPRGSMPPICCLGEVARETISLFRRR